MSGLRLLGTGRALPSRLVTSDDMSSIVETSDEWIVSRTGIRQRYFCAEGESAETLAIAAAGRALASAGIAKEEIGCVVCATSSATYAMPSMACQVHHALGLSQKTLLARIREAGVRVNDGLFFGEQGCGFIRLNIACPRAQLAAALERMAKALG